MTPTPDGAWPAAPMPERIVDAHHHLWDLSSGRYEWQAAPGAPADSADPFRHDYLAADLLSDAAAVPLIGSIHVEAAWDHTSPVEETRWLSTQVARTGLPHALVAGIRLEAPDAEEVITGHLESPHVRGVRQMLDWDPRAGAPQPPPFLDDPGWRSRLRLLGAAGLTFDLQVLPDQLIAAAELARQHPDVRFVLDHAGYRVPRDPSADDLWRAGLRALAVCPNVSAKVSGYATVDPSWEPAAFRDFVRTVIAAFGPVRTMFGSNFPVDKATITYPRLISLCAWAVRDLSAPERDAFFAGTAMRVYRLGAAARPPGRRTASTVTSTPTTRRS